MINGVPQKYGRQYKATEVKATKNSFSANIATAYPDEAGVKKWIRSYTMKSDALMISDRFELNEIKKENVINFLSWGDIIIKDGVIEISVNGVKGTLKYDTKMFKVKKECVKLTDKKLSSVWGAEVYRLSFIAKEKEQKGCYTFTTSF